jgi:hypothetical protein
MIALLARFLPSAPAPQPNTDAEDRRTARRIESERQRKSYAERRAAECRAARLRFTGEQA